jgi:hypothetical protein
MEIFFLKLVNALWILFLSGCFLMVITALYLNWIDPEGRGKL